MSVLFSYLTVATAYQSRISNIVTSLVNNHMIDISPSQSAVLIFYRLQKSFSPKLVWYGIGQSS